MHLHFNAISEAGLPGKKWQEIYNTHWKSYKAWLNTQGNVYDTDLKTSQAALKKYMPEMWPTYLRLCKLAEADDLAARFLTGFQPPAYISACSNAVLTGDEIQLVRNYDYHPHLTEGTQLMSAWNGKKVIATTDCLIGALDGMNEDGLTVSLTFGGRKNVGKGFGIPFILRYVLEFCSNVEEAVEALLRIPSHMSYNVTVVDKTGTFKTVELAPDKKALVTDAAFTTNHQGTSEWTENAAFDKTIERAAFIENMLAKKGMDAITVANSFLQKPLYNSKFNVGFGTLFTAVYKPTEGLVEMRWPNHKISQTIEGFQEQYKLINYNQAFGTPANIVKKARTRFQRIVKPEAIKNRSEIEAEWQKGLSPRSSSPAKEQEYKRRKILNIGKINRKKLVDFWPKPRTGRNASKDN
ncbi:MAG: C45 family peptidase [Brumimicrobium sp.]